MTNTKKTVLFLLLSAFLATVIAQEPTATAGSTDDLSQAQSIAHIQIIRTTQIRPELDPDALILKMARAGEIYSVIDVGNIWYTVTTDKGVGYVAQQDCRIVDANGRQLGSTPLHTILFILLLFAAVAGGIVFFIRRNRHLEFE